MKNIHILPAKEDSPSRLHINAIGNLGLNPGRFTAIKNPLVLYITSYENVKKGVRQWYLDKFLHKPMNSNGAEYQSKLQGIILTTDPTLIADGVQAIDDEFLEWFVKNPTCEFVEVNKKLVEFPLTFKMMYKIIIPQEEPKQDLEKEMFELEQELDIPSSMRWHNSKPKRETLEEVLPKNSNGKYSRNEIEKAFESGAKWQAERMYSEEDMAEAFIACWKANVPDGIECKVSFNEWFEQFKKK